MTRKVKCKFCGKELTNDTAFKVHLNNKNLYYCSKAEYDFMQVEKSNRKELLRFISLDIFNYDKKQLLPSIMIKKISELNKSYTYEVILETFKENKDTLIYWLNVPKKFKTEYQKVSYVMAIISNNINDCYEKIKLKEKQNNKVENDLLKQSVEIDDINKLNNMKINTKTKDISEFLD